MKKVIKKKYANPKTEIFIIKTNEHLLQQASTSGGHESAGDDETLNAKKAWIFIEEDEGSARKKLWED